MLSTAGLKYVEQFFPFVLYLFGIYAMMSVIFIGGIVVFIDDGGNTGRLILGWSEVASYLFGNILLLWAVAHRNIVQIWRSIILLLFAGILFISFMRILQLADQYVNENGSGKVPMTQPHDEFWYSVNAFFVTYTYIFGAFTILQALISSILVLALTQLKKKEKPQKVKYSINNDLQEVFLEQEKEEDFCWTISAEGEVVEQSILAFNTYPSKPNQLLEKSDHYQIDAVEENEKNQSSLLENSKVQNSSYNSYFKTKF